MWFTKRDYMRNYLILIFSLLIFSGCGGGSGGAAGSNGQTGSTIPVGSVSGTSFDGLVINGTVKVYDYTTGSKGALLAQATTDAMGLYNLSLQVESRPVLLELTGGYYVEEAGSNANITLSTNHKLIAVANYTTGAALKVSVTTYTYLAAGLAQYEISKGTAVSTAIDNSNQRISSLVGVNILTTTPKAIIDVANASASLTPELRYGFLAGAISLWTYNNAPSTAVAHLAPHPYTSIDFAQTLYQDISADGVWDGFGTDSTGAKAQLSFGAVPLGVAVYRLGIGTAIVQMAGNANNKTGLTGAQVLSFANSYIANTDPIFNSVAPVTFAASTLDIVSPADNMWHRKTINVVPTASSPFGIKTVEFLVDGVTVSTSSNAAPAAFPFDTTIYVEGAHTVSVRSTDLGGFVSTKNIQANIDRTPPASTGSYFYTYNPTRRSNIGTASDNLSGAASATILANGQVSTVTMAGAWSLVTDISPLDVLWPTIRIQDKAGNCSDYSYNNYYGVFSLVAAGTCP